MKNYNVEPNAIEDERPPILPTVIVNPNGEGTTILPPKKPKPT